MKLVKRKERLKMANIEKHMVAKLSMKKGCIDLALDYKNDWCIPIKKIWNNKEVDRFTFRLADDEGVLECGPKLAKELSYRVGLMLEHACVDTNKIGSIKVIVARNDKNPAGFCVGMDTSELPKKSRLTRMWFSIKRAFK